MKEETYINLGKSIHVFNEIELFISYIITHYIEPKDKTFFIDFILNPKVVGFGAKLKILINLDIFDKAQIEKIRDLSINRNVFAHSNRTQSAEVDDETNNSNSIGILVSDVIFKTNSNGKLIKISYSDFIKKHLELQNKIIDIISKYIIENKINTHYNHIENLKLFKT